MPRRCKSAFKLSPLRVSAALALVLVVAGCTKGGQFDPTEIFNSDTFDTKKKMTGDREPVFPNGVPGTTTGVPAELVKGYQPPPEQPDANAAPAPGPTAEAAPPKPKAKPKPKVAVGPAQRQDSVWNKPASGPTRISVGAASKSPAPAPSSQAPWPSPSQAAPSSQAPWPAPAQTPPAQQTGQSVWQNPPAPGGSSQ